MAIGVYFHPGSMTAQQYDEIIRELQAAGCAQAPGRISHCAFCAADNLMVFDIWESPQAFEDYGKVLMPILQKIGLATSPADVMPIHHLIT